MLTIMPATTRASRRRRATDTQVIGGILAALDINNGGTSKPVEPKEASKLIASDFSDLGKDDDTPERPGPGIEKKKLELPPSSVIISSQILSPDASLCMSELSADSERRRLTSPKFLFPRQYSGLAEPESALPEEISYCADEESSQRRRDVNVKTDNDVASNGKSADEEASNDGQSDQDDDEENYNISDATSEREFEDTDESSQFDSEEDELSEQDETDFINDNDETDEDQEFSPPLKKKSNKIELEVDDVYIPEDTEEEYSDDELEIDEEECDTTTKQTRKSTHGNVEAVAEILQETTSNSEEAVAIAMVLDEEETDDEDSVIFEKKTNFNTAKPDQEASTTTNDDVAPFAVKGQSKGEHAVSVVNDDQKTPNSCVDKKMNNNDDTMVVHCKKVDNAGNLSFDENSDSSADGTVQSDDVSKESYLTSPIVESHLCSIQIVDKNGTEGSTIKSQIDAEKKLIIASCDDDDWSSEESNEHQPTVNDPNSDKYEAALADSEMNVSVLQTSDIQVDEGGFFKDEMTLEKQAEDNVSVEQVGNDAYSDCHDFSNVAMQKNEVDSLSDTSSDQPKRSIFVDLGLIPLSNTFTTSKAADEPSSPFPKPSSFVKRVAPKPEHTRESDTAVINRKSTNGHKNKREGSVRRGKWALGQKIGIGSFGVVHVGMNMQTGKLMAVKSIELAPSAMKDIRCEIDVLKSLEHINIVRYLGAERDEKKLHIFQEWVPGGSVTDLINKFGAFPISVVQSYLSQILTGLAYLHQNGILHRDIKGGNVLITDHGIVKLADFGASKRLAHQQADMMESLTMRGTPYFMAPEVFEEKYGGKADIWSVGCVAFQMASGSPPWKAQGYTNPMSLFLYLKKSEGSPPMNWPENTSVCQSAIEVFEGMLTKCFYRNPAQRPTAQSLILDPFFVTFAASEDEMSCSQNLFSPGSKSCSTFAPIVKTPKAADTPLLVPLMTPPLPTRIQAKTSRLDTVSPLPAFEWPTWARESLKRSIASPMGNKFTMEDSLARSEDTIENPFRRQVLDEGETFKISVGTLSTLDGLVFLEGENKDE